MAAASCRLPNGRVDCPTADCPTAFSREKEKLLSQPLKPAPAVPFSSKISSPYDLFRREQQPLQPFGLSKGDREKRLSQLWRALPETKKAKYKSGLTCFAALGKGGSRTWVPTSAPSLRPAPTTKATMIQSNERRWSGSHFTVTPVPPRRPPSAPAAASAAVPHAPSITPTIPSSSWLKQQQLAEESSVSVWKASEVAVEETLSINGELSDESWLNEINIEKAIQETILESDAIWEALHGAIEEELRAGLQDGIVEASVPFLGCGREGARSSWAGAADVAVKNFVADDEPVTSGGAQSTVALMMPATARSGLEVTTEAIPAGLAADEEATFGLHDSPPARATETATRLTMAHPEHVTTAGIQQADPEWLSELYRKLDEDGTGRQGITLTTSPTHESFGHGQGSLVTPVQQALHAARQCMQRSHPDAEKYQVVRTLALALGAKRPASGTIKALQAVLMLLERPEMSDEEAYTFTGASLSNFKRWQKQVQSLQSACVGVSLA